MHAGGAQHWFNANLAAGIVRPDTAATVDSANVSATLFAIYFLQALGRGAASQRSALWFVCV